MREDETISLCPVCLGRIPARYAREANGDIYMEKACPAHGAFRVPLWRGAPGFEDWRREEANEPPRPDVASRLGCPYDCGLCPAHRQSPCCVLVDVTERCSGGCKVCFAAAGPAGAHQSLEALEALGDELQARSEGAPYNIQLSGGEPAEHPDIERAVGLFSERFPYVQMNTNGLRLAQEPAFAQRLAEAGLSCVFLQFYGTGDGIYESLCGRPLMAEKLRAVEHCGAAGLPVVLAMNVMPGVNGEEIGPALRFAMERMPVVRGVHFLPVSRMGRYGGPLDPAARMTLPELLRAMERQTQYAVSRDDFVPLVSGSCACSFHGSFFVDGGAVTPLTTRDDALLCACKQDAIRRARAYLARRWGSAPTGAGDLPLDAHGFVITAMAFMDAWNFDVRRAEKCRLHVAKPGGLYPFCAYNVTSAQGERLYGRG